MSEIFGTEFLPAVEGGGSLIRYQDWRRQQKGEATLWDAYKALVLAYKKGDPTPTPPVLKTRFGKMLVAAAEQHVSVIDLGSVWPDTPGTVVITSSITDGDTVQQGEVWTVTASEAVDSIEFWIEGVLHTDAVSPYQHTIDLAPGIYEYNICYWKAGTRTCLDTGTGVLGAFTVAGTPSGFDVDAWEVTFTGPGGYDIFRQSWLLATYPYIHNAGYGGYPCATLCTPQSPSSFTFRTWEWWYLYEFWIDPTWSEPSEGSIFASPLDLHTTPGDIGWEPGNGSGTGSSHLRYFDNNLILQHEYELDAGRPHELTLVSNISKGSWHSIALHTYFGRTDGSVPASGHPNGGNGGSQVWVDGAKVFEDLSMNTLQKHPTTGYVQQRQTILQGVYAPSASTPHTFRFTQGRAGRTLAEAQLPESRGTRSTIYYAGQQAIDAHTWTQLNPRSSSNFILPA